MAHKRQHPGEALALKLEPRERALARQLHEKSGSRIQAVAYIKSRLACTLREAIDADDYLTYTVE